MKTHLSKVRFHYFFTFNISSAEQFKKVHSIESVDKEGRMRPDKY